MVYPSLPSLLDLCGIRFAYLMWSRHDVSKDLPKELLFEELLDVILADVQSFPLPERVKLRIMPHLKPVGRHLLSLLNIWLLKTRHENSQKWLTSDILFECLTINAYGLIDQRKTAQKLLSNLMLDNEFAFRLACVNFLETEVLKLWPSVNLYFLNKLVLDCGHPLGAESQISWWQPYGEVILNYAYNGLECPDIEMLVKRECSPTFPCTTEPYEVLFWISYCFSKSNAIDIKEVPHFLGQFRVWYESSLNEAALSGNVACFDYFKNCRIKKVDFNHVKMIEKMFASEEEDHQLQCFIFHFVRLCFEERADVFQKFPRQVMSYFLQWPLSITFLENTQDLWDLIPDGDKNWIFLKIVSLLFHKYCLLAPLRSFFYSQRVLDRNNPRRITGIYSVEHLVNIWVSLWKISIDSFKLLVLNEFVFPSIVFASPCEDFRSGFETSGLKAKLLSLFLSDGEAVLDLYEGTDLKKSLRNLVAKHMPEEFDDIDRECISFLKAEPYQFLTVMSNVTLRDPSYKPRLGSNTVYDKFVSYIKLFMFSTNSMDNTFFYN